MNKTDTATTITPLIDVFQSTAVVLLRNGDMMRLLAAEAQVQAEKTAEDVMPCGCCSGSCYCDGDVGGVPATDINGALLWRAERPR